MANKGSYRSKYLERTSAGDERPAEKKEYPQLSEAQRNRFEAGVVLLIDKPPHWTSFDVVRKIRSIIRIKKVGHAGTLDPLATGLLIVCTGKFTKKINEFMSREKEYTGSFTLGAETPTYDLESLPENHRDISGIGMEDIQSAAKKFLGETEQLPPVYSAIKQKGTPLYTLARRGEAVELQPRKIFIHSFEITFVELPNVYFKISCSTGTYIRSIASDFGKALGCGAYLSSLRRTKIGEFDVADAVSVENIVFGS